MVRIIFLVLAIAALGCAGATTQKDQAQLMLRHGTKQLIDNNYEQAFKTLKEAEELDREDPVIQNNLGLAYFVKKDFGEAEGRFKSALKLKPSYSDALNNLARVHIELTRYDEAIVELNNVTKDLSYPTVEKAYVNLGLAYLKKGNSALALNHFRRAIDANGKFCPAHNYYGQALFNLQKFDEALESFETALKLCNNNYDEARYYRALSYYKTGSAEKAETDFKTVVKLYPGTELAKKSERMLELLRLK